MQELDIRIALAVLMKKIKWVLLITLAGAVALGAYTKFLVADTYRSSCTMYVINLTKVEDDQSITSGNLATSRALIEDYIVILKNGKVIDEVAAHLRQQGYVMTNRAILQTLSMEAVDESAMLEVSATTTNPQLSKAICDAMYEVAPDMIKEVMQGMGMVSQMDAAKTGGKVGPNVMRNVILGGLFAFVLSYGAFLVLHLMDKTIHDERELKRRLDVTVLGSVPSLHNAKAKKGGK